MTRLTLKTLNDAAPEARPFLESALKNSGFIPNLLALLAHAPTALETYVTVSGINAKTGLTLAEREVVQLIAATTHGCNFCVAGHTAVATHKAKLPADVISALREQTALPNPRYEALAQFTRDIIATRGRVSDADYQEFLQAGYTEANSLEVILGVSLATLCNFANSFAGTSLNPELAQYRWQKAAV